MSEAPKKSRPKSKSRRSQERIREAVFPKLLKKLLVAALLVLILTVVGAAVFFINYFQNSSSDVVIEIEGPEEVYRGVPFELEVSVSNKTNVLISQTELKLDPTSGIVDLGGLSTDEFSTDVIGDLGSGSLAKKTYRLLATGRVDGVEEITFNLSYFTSERNRFEISNAKKIRIKASAVEFEIKRPDQILPGSTFELNIEYKNVSDFDLPETFLEVRYPPAFKFLSASLNPDSLNNYWRLGELRRNSSGNLQIRGTLEGVDNTSFTFPIVFGARFLGEDFPVAEEEVELTISPSPIGINILINRQTNYIARIGDRLAYTIQYQNNSGIALTDVVVVAELNGELYDFATLSTNGDVNPGNLTVVWDVSKVPSLRLVDPGSSGEVSLEIRLKDQFPIARLNDKDFTLRFSAEVTSPSVPFYLSASETKARTSVETKVAGLITVDSQAFYRDSLSKIVNSGPMPPKVGEATEYTIHWFIRNFATDVSNISVRTILPPGVLWTGIVKSNVDSVPLYNEETKEVLWTIDKIRATKGVLDEPLAAVFQVRATPAPSDAGRFQELISATNLRATDDFTNRELTASDVALDTSLPDDITIGQGGGRVVP